MSRDAFLRGWLRNGQDLLSMGQVRGWRCRPGRSKVHKTDQAVLKEVDRTLNSLLEETFMSFCASVQESVRMRVEDGREKLSF